MTTPPYIDKWDEPVKDQCNLYSANGLCYGWISVFCGIDFEIAKQLDQIAISRFQTNKLYS